MKYLVLFEKYLESNYSPLYHYTRSSLEKILESDQLIKKPPFKGVDCVCVTRSPIYKLDFNVSPRLKLDQNKLRLDGYTSIPIDEFSGDKKSLNRKIGKNKSYTDDNTTEWEFEERIYKDIKNLGKYIISIQFPKRDENRDSYFFGLSGKRYYPKDFVELDVVKNYLIKYPHIILESYNVSKRWKTELFKED